MDIKINNVTFKETKEKFPKEGLFYKEKWYVPEQKYEYKEGDWVIYSANGFYATRKIVSAVEEIEDSFFQMDCFYGDNNWMTLAAVKTYSELILRLATEEEIKSHLASLAKEKGYSVGILVKESEDSFKYITEEDDDYDSTSDSYYKSGILLYKNGRWAKKSDVLFFGGQCVFFNIVKGREKYNTDVIEITCKGETDTNYAIERILENYFKPTCFGSKTVKSFTFKENLINNTFIVDSHKDVIDKITIGCLTGTYQELINIQKHCQILLKNNEKNNNTVADSNNQYNG